MKPSTVDGALPTVVAPPAPPDHDPLTGLARREALLGQGPLLLANAAEVGRPAVLLVLDLDGFKQLNDAAGHHVGDQVLAEVGARLRRTAEHGDLVVRLGGDEFAVLSAPLEAPESGAARARAFIRALTMPLEVDDLSLSVGVSVGLASYGQDGNTVEELLCAADQAMYAAKTAGSCQWRASTPPGSLDEGRTRRLLADLRAGRAVDQMLLHYQPQVSMTTGDIVGFETLVRWDHDELGLLKAREFIPLAERTGSMGPITLAVLEGALGDMAELQRLAPGARLAINVTRRHMLARGLVDNLYATVQRHGLSTQDIVLEISESATGLAPESSDVFDTLSRDGFAVSIRGFGTARSSLTALWSNPAVREVKVDPSIAALVDDDETLRLVRALINAAHSLGIRVVAEGVEGAAAAAALRRLGCDVLQGFLVCRPAPLAELRDWCASWRRERVLDLGA
ncbi:putative bifunctional diguanylate cyclase/phosphodiesterase [Nocardioides sp.]|uniref:putative bifunctional diguanylate cyclase/phosphodiesterase n=1 Tax=Nocardioides sp. TaxID=35761 RepID=UPI002B26C5D7|nr:EAL domain-containing protein [Nocardioides sp.]